MPSVEQTIVVADKQMTFYLLQGVKDYTHKDEQ